MQSYPFRVWTTWGWQWQARLCLGDQLHWGLESDQALRQWFADIDVNSNSTDGWSALDDLVLH